MSAVRDWAAHNNRSMLRFEYSGHGSSEGQFTDGTIGQWLRESLAILREVAEGPQILTGSSMGAWLVLLILRAIADQTPEADGLPPVVGAVQIAPSFDMTEDLMWNIFSDQARQALETEGYCNRTSRYDDDPYRITRTLIEEGRNHLIGSDPFELPCPVHIIHGIDDPDVPWQHANRLTFLLLGNDVTTYFIQKGDHRLSRPHEIEKMLVIIEDLYRTAMKNKVHI